MFCKPPGMEESIRRGSGAPAGLWSQGISGDLPILLVRVTDGDGDTAARDPLDLLVERFLAARRTEAKLTVEAFAAAKAVMAEEAICLQRGDEVLNRQPAVVRGAVGDWDLTLCAINELIDDMVQPTTEVARVIGAVAVVLRETVVLEILEQRERVVHPRQQPRHEHGGGAQQAHRDARPDLHGQRFAFGPRAGVRPAADQHHGRHAVRAGRDGARQGCARLCSYSWKPESRV